MAMADNWNTIGRQRGKGETIRRGVRDGYLCYMYI